MALHETRVGSRRLRKGSRCPTCSEGRLIPIAYGYPGPGLAEASERGEVALGGCLVNYHLDAEGNMVGEPELSCPRCGGEFCR